MCVRMLMYIMVSGLHKWRKCVTLSEYNLPFPIYVAANLTAQMFQLKIHRNFIDAQLQFQSWITFCQRLNLDLVFIRRQLYLDYT